MIRPSPNSTLFPYTTLFRSVVDGLAHFEQVVAQRRLARLLLRPLHVGDGHAGEDADDGDHDDQLDRKSTRLNSSHSSISYAVFCLKKKNKETEQRELLISSV